MTKPMDPRCYHDDDNDDDESRLRDGYENNTIVHRQIDEHTTQKRKPSNDYGDPRNLGEISNDGRTLSVNDDNVKEYKNPTKVVFGNMDEIMMVILSFLAITNKGSNKSVSKRWNILNTQSIEQSPKQPFETNEELRRAVLAYCGIGGRVKGMENKLPPPTQIQVQKVLMVYGTVINDWNVSKLTNFEYVFHECEEFNESISSWDTSNATNMKAMFLCASSFNQPLNTWNTSMVKNMEFMFSHASSFNQPLSTWNTSMVKVMTYMFSHSSSFNQPLNAWNTSNVHGMQCMFNNALSFNQPLNAWNTSNVHGMQYMFNNAVSFNQPLNAWNTSRVKKMEGMFDGAFLFNHPIDMWDTTSIQNQNQMP